MSRVDNNILCEIKLSVLQNIFYSLPIYQNITENLKSLQQEKYLQTYAGS